MSQEPAEQDVTNLICTFCRTNDPRIQVYSGHAIKDKDGKVSCPVLRRYVCPLCGATGDDAHTVRYCSRSRDKAVPDVRKLKTTERNACKSRTVLQRRFWDFQFGASGGMVLGWGHSIGTTTGLLLRTVLCKSLVLMPRVKFVEKYTQRGC